MRDWRDDDRAVRLLRGSAVVYALAIVVHLADHARRGTDASPRAVIALGSLAVVLQFTAIAAALLRQKLAPVLAIAVGLPEAFGIFAVHLLPRWSFLSDSFPDHAPGVTAFSWVTAIVELLASLAFAYAGWRALRAVRRTA